MRSSLLDSLFARRSTAEVLVLCLAIAALVVGLRPQGEAAHWLALLPTLIALKHGLVPGALGIAAWAGAIAYVERAAKLPFDVVAFLPETVLTLLVGQFREHWHASRAALRSERDTQQRQLEQLYRAHGTLRASHAQLSERLAARTWSLESAVREAEQQMTRGDLHQAARSLLDLLATQARVGAASLFVCDRTSRALGAQPIAQLGAPGECDARDALIVQAFTRGAVVAIAPEGSASPPHPARVLVAVPLVDAGGATLGVVAIHALPFVCFHHAHFAHVALLATRLADALADKLRGSLGVAAVCALPPADLPFTPLPKVKPLPNLPPLRAPEKPASVAPGAKDDDSGIREANDVEARVRTQQGAATHTAQV